MRRLLALTLLFVTTVSSTEAVLGVVRDGEVHHENNAVAAAHAQQSSGDHGHEDAAETGDHRHDEGHEHGTAGDHCTHTHSLALLTSTASPLLVECVEFSTTDSRLPHEVVSEGLAHPPRA